MPISGRFAELRALRALGIVNAVNTIGKNFVNFAMPRTIHAIKAIDGLAEVEDIEIRVHWVVSWRGVYRATPAAG